MKTLFSRSTQYLAGLAMFLLALSPANGIGAPPGVMVAKLTPDTAVTREDQAVFDRNQPEMRKVMAVQNRHTRSLMAVPEVVGTASGVTDAGLPAILVLTRRETVPGVIPASLEGVPVVVKVTGELVALAAPSSRKFSTTAILPPPVPIGVSTGNAGECSAGTIGARVTKGGAVYALSNNHVYALENGASKGSEVVQPGLYDTQCLTKGNNVLGTLADFVPIRFNNTDCDPAGDTSTCNTVDAAIAASSSAELGNATPANGYGTPGSTPVTPSVGLAVQKYGRTTSLTRGTISGINATVNVSYGTGKNALFINQVLVSSGKPFSKAGDSGSLIVTGDAGTSPVGLLFAGGGGVTVANPIDLVLGSFGVAVDGK